MKPAYTPRYFIEKFEAIPEENWIEGVMNEEGGKSCALGHCAGYVSSLDPQTYERSALAAMFDFKVSMINDGRDHRYQQPTPKQRVLAALRDLAKTP